MKMNIQKYLTKQIKKCIQIVEKIVIIVMIEITNITWASAFLRI